VVDVRNYGLMAAVELDAVAGRVGTLGPAAMAELWQQGVMVRGIGDAIAMSPPLIIEKPQIDRIVNTLSDVLPGIG
ncbi:MAG: aminotransferase class III-fold pyridoxal phosphate-dependent enzyme, partial [Pseudomonadota bacterium]|nr:aminotransferase class III-fold pyridoxal phosphate-dependent enzyme [Pseudomonadota bacterium]